VNKSDGRRRRSIEKRLEDYYIRRQKDLERLQKQKEVRGKARRERKMRRRRNKNPSVRMKQ